MEDVTVVENAYGTPQGVPAELTSIPDVCRSPGAINLKVAAVAEVWEIHGGSILHSGRSPAFELL